MKLIAFFLFAGLCQVSATAFGQRETVTFSRDAMTLEEIFTTIRKQLQYDIFYSNEELDTHQKIQLSARKMNVEGVLKEILKGKYSYEFIEKTIVIRPLRKIGVEQEQENVIKGKVVDVHGKPLPGVTIRVDSTSLGCSSNVDGEFELTLRQDKGHLVFSFIGFKTKRVAFTRGKFLSVTLEEEVTEMEEVIVNGMFTQNRNSYTGSVTTMKGEDILAVSNTNLLKAISVLSPGLRLVENNEMGSNPNYIPEIIIRGTTSIASQGEYGLNTPLIILDGVEISITQLYDLDIYEIERVDVLKDASATSIYGEKAANGVIV
ncbi:SusC/RagA family TonB-linked outer membrane protein, partial [Butyricimonas sp.]